MDFWHNLTNVNRSYTSNRTTTRNRVARTTRWSVFILLGALALMVAVPTSGLAGATIPDLGSAGTFGVLAGSAVTNTGPTTVDGDLGVSPGTAVSGFPPGLVTGTIHRGDAVAAQAQSDATIAYNEAAGQACDFNLTGQNLGGMTLIPGVYCFDSSAQLTGQLTLDGQGNSNSAFIFQIGSTLTTASNSTVQVINSAQPCNIFWQVGSSATLGTTTDFAGNILALTSITLNTDAATSTGLYALNGAVTLDTNDIHACSFVQGPTSTPTAASTGTAISGTATRTTVPSTNTPANTPTNIQTSTPTRTPTNTTTSTPTNTPRGTPIPEETELPTETVVPNDTATAIALATETLVPNDTATAIALATETLVPNDTATAIALATETLVPNDTATAIATDTAISTPAGTATDTAISTPAGTPTDTAISTATSISIVTTPATTTTAIDTATVVTTGTSTPTPTPFLPRTGGGRWADPFVLLLAVVLLMIGLNIRMTFRKMGKKVRR